MQIIGLTGSIGSGKSTVLAMCRDMGIPTLDTDHVVHQLLMPGGKATQKVADAFPETASKLGINRHKLGELVFADKRKLKTLEQIMHPLVKAEVEIWLKQQRKRRQKQVVVEVPLMFEIGWQQHYPFIITTAASLPCLRIRALKRPNMTPQKLRAILKRQWPQAKKIAHSDVVVYSGVGYGKALREMNQIFWLLDR